ncbi:MAG: transglutaminase family protein [Elusimicrobia bacterium]|nr:transglutaminase family protein [Elusimicrobiota bacterium]
MGNQSSLLKRVPEKEKIVRLHVRHWTRYQYDRPVFLEPHILRIRPCPTHSQTLIEHSLSISPEPVGISLNKEQDGTISHFVCFQEHCRSLTVESKVWMDLKPMNPFDFILYPTVLESFPMQYPPEIARSLSPYLATVPLSSAVHQYALEILKEVNGKTIAFLMALCQKIHADFNYERRHTGEPYSPEKTLQTRRGSCRDFVVLSMAVAQSIGIACRFVSGYFFEESSQSSPELHAWMEAYLPGGGWRGFDATIGLACAQNHIALATGNSAALAAPIQGTFRGKAESELKVKLKYETQPLSG